MTGRPRFIFLPCSKQKQLIQFFTILTVQLLIAYKAGDKFSELTQLEHLDTVYNGAISPSGNQIIYCVRNDADASEEHAYLIRKEGDKWSSPINL